MNLFRWSIRNIGLQKLLWAVLFIVYLNLAGYFSYPQPRLKLDHVFDWFVNRCTDKQ